LAKIPPKFCITGTGRSGTGYISAALQACGVNCGHERWFIRHGRQSGLDGDASWQAIFFLRDYRGPIYLQVRDPLAGIASLAKYTVFPDWWAKFCKTDDPLENGICAYYFRNLIYEPIAARRWRVEDVDADLLIWLGELAGKDIPRPLAERAIRQTSQTTNHYGDTRRLTWNDLPDNWITAQLRLMAVRYGYPI